jgi:hypothetical protein
MAPRPGCLSRIRVATVTRSRVIFFSVMMLVVAPVMRLAMMPRVMIRPMLVMIPSGARTRRIPAVMVVISVMIRPMPGS